MESRKCNKFLPLKGKTQSFTSGKCGPTIYSVEMTAFINFDVLYNRPGAQLGVKLIFTCLHEYF